MSQSPAYALLAVFEDTMKMRVEVSFPTAIGFFAVLRSYNNLDSTKMRILLQTLDALIPKVQYPDVGGRQNPNNGKRSYTVHVGRESSPVLYIHRYLYRNNPPLSQELIVAVNRAAKEALADEISYRQECIDDGPMSVSIEEFRFWWD